MEPNIGPVKPVGDKLVAVDFTLFHLPFFQRKGGSGVITYHFVGGYWELWSANFPDFRDFDVFLGALKLYQDMKLKGKVIEGVQYKYFDKEGEEKVAGSCTIITNQKQLCEYSGKKSSGQNGEKVDMALKKLSLLTAYRYTYKQDSSGKFLKKEKPETARIMRFLSYHERIGDNNTLTFDANFIKACVEDKRILVRYRHVQSFGDQIYKGMLLFIEGNEGHLLSGVQESRIMRFLGVNEPIYPKNKNVSEKTVQKYFEALSEYKIELKRVRNVVKSALEAFVKKGIICDFAIPDRKAKGSERKYYIGKKKSYKDVSKKTRSFEHPGDISEKQEDFHE